jgi:CheY-like chemotaxis protein
MKILIVDDDNAAAALAQFVLELEGYEVKLVINGEDGYSSYLQFRPDLVITEIQRPGTNGFDLINQIRKQEPMVKTIYTSDNLYLFYADIKEEKTKYPIAFLDKPFSRSELIGRVSSFIN